jgi:hypothetical protein
MTLINTDGMAFIGPGTEWFWTALTGVVLGVTFIAIYSQLRVQATLAQPVAVTVAPPTTAEPPAE